MTRKELETLGLEKEIIDTVMQLNGQAIEKYKGEVATLTDTNKALEADIAKFKEVDIDGLNAQLSTLQADYDTLQATKEEELTSVKKQNAFDKLVRDSGTVDNDLLKLSLQDYVKEAEFKDGGIVGLEDKIAEIKESKPILFNKPTVATGAGHTKVPVDKQTDKDILFKSMGIKTK